MQTYDDPQKFDLVNISISAIRSASERSRLLIDLYQRVAAIEIQLKNNEPENRRQNAEALDLKKLRRNRVRYQLFAKRGLGRYNFRSWHSLSKAGRQEFIKAATKMDLEQDENQAGLNLYNAVFSWAAQIPAISQLKNEFSTLTKVALTREERLKCDREDSDIARRIRQFDRLRTLRIPYNRNELDWIADLEHTIHELDTK